MALIGAAWLATVGCGGTTGQRLYQYGGCASCHGRTFAGGRLAPSLKGLEERWAVGDLDRFLQDPLGYKEQDPRLKVLAKQYPAPMPLLVMSSADRKRLVDYLMEATRRP